MMVAIKKNLLWICFLFLVIPAQADDDLKPEPLDQAIRKFDEIQKNEDVDPMNHEIWKLYVLYDLTPMNGYDKTPKWFVTTLAPGLPYRVQVSINQIYNFIQPPPKRGDVIVVEGRVTNHYKLTVDNGTRRFQLPVLSMYLEGAELSKEKFDPDYGKGPAAAKGAVPTPTPGGPRMGQGLSAQGSPTATPSGPGR